MPSKKDLGAALERVKPPTMAMIRADREGAPGVVAKFLATMEDHLFDEKVNVRKLKALAEIRDNSFSTKFRAAIGSPPLRYLRCRQLEVAERLLRDYGLEVGEVAMLVGMSELKPFGRRFRAWCGKTPTEVRLQEVPPEVDYHTHMRAFFGELSDGEAYRFAGRFFRLYPRVARRFGGVPAEEPRRAEDLWRQIRELPFAEQRARVRRHFFRTTALFDLLRRKSREEGRRDRQRGVDLAELALASLDRCAESLTERGHDHQALGLADLANARRLALDFDGSAEQFQQAYAEWHTPRESPDELVLAEIYGRHGTLLMFQRQYERALDLLGKTVALSGKNNDQRNEILALVQRAAVRGYMGDLTEGLADLEAARRLTDETRSEFVRFIVQFNLVALRNRLGDQQSAAAGLVKLKVLRNTSIYQIREDEVEHLEGNIKEAVGDLSGAERRYKKAHRRFMKAKQWRGATFAAMDLGALYSRQARHGEVLSVVSGLVPVLSSLRLYPESLAAVRLLAEAAQKRTIQHSLLSEIREQLERDPLLLLA